MNRVGSAVWRGGLKDGSGVVSTQSKALNSLPYSFAMRFGEEPGTNPEELIGAAHSGCFSMALAGQLNAAGFSPTAIETKATVSIEKDGPGWSVTRVHLEVVAEVPGASAEAFEKAAGEAKTGCPISKLLKAPITMTARLGTVSATQAA